MTAAIVFGLLALTRPQWGYQWKETKRRGVDILIALDVSHSMLASDVKPSRLERAKLALRDFATQLKGDRIGLIAFAGSAFLQCPLTTDTNGFLLSLEGVDPSTIPRGGTSISGAIREAIRTYAGTSRKDKTLILITDGEDHEGDPLDAAEEAKKQGIVIHAIGIGTREGELISFPEQDGQKEFLKDTQGNVVKSSLNEKVLQDIALATGGLYVRATTAEFGLELLYRQQLSALEKTEVAGKMIRDYHERFQIFLALALLSLLAEIFVSARRRDARAVPGPEVRHE